MRKFDFRLEPVLKHREIIEEQAAVRHAGAQDEYRRNSEYLCDARDRLADVREVQALDPFDMFNRTAFCSYMTEEIKRRETALHRSEKKLEKCRASLVKAMQNRSVLEKLREKELNIYNQTVSTVEQKETDEIAVSMYNMTSK